MLYPVFIWNYSVSSAILLLDKDIPGLNLLGNGPGCTQQLPAPSDQRCAEEEVVCCLATVHVLL